MKKYLCVGCYNEYNSRAEAETCCGEEAEEMDEEENQNNEESEDKTELTE